MRAPVPWTPDDLGRRLKDERIALEEVLVVRVLESTIRPIARQVGAGPDLPCSDRRRSAPSPWVACNEKREGQEGAGGRFGG